MSFKKRRNRVLKEKLKSTKQEVEETRDIVQKVQIEIENLFKEKYFPEEKIKAHQDQTDIQKSKQDKQQQDKQQRRVPIEPPPPNEHLGEDDILPDSSNNINKDPKLRKMFKSIAKETHPDILAEKSDFEKQQKKKLFDAARRAYEEDDFDTLIEVSETLGLETPDLPDSHYDEISNQIMLLIQELSMLHSTLFWKWFICSNENAKEKILNDIFKRMQDYVRS